MKLYWCPMSRATRAIWALEESGLAYDRVLIDIRNGEQNTPEFRAISSLGKVPALEDRGIGFADSTAICAYVADKAPDAKLAPPASDPMRGRYLQWLLFTGIYFEPGVIFKMKNVDMDKSTVGWGSIEENYTILDKTLQQGPWLLGDHFTMADVLVGSTLRFGRQMGFVPDMPSITAYVARCDERPALKRALAIEEQEGHKEQA